MEKMRANVFRGVNDIRVEEVERPCAGVGEAVIRVTLTTICGTDLHIVRGEYPVRSGLVIGHEPVGVIAELGEGVSGYEIGDRVLVGAINIGCLPIVKDERLIGLITAYDFLTVSAKLFEEKLKNFS